MCWMNLRRVIMTGCTALFLLAVPTASQAACALTDWLFGNGQTSYAPAYAPPAVYVPPTPMAPACGCAPVRPACQPCVPAATYRITYRPVATVAYMPVVGVDPCSGCAVTTYQPKRTWTYQAALVPYTPYRAAYAPTVAVAPCGSCGCAPCSGYAASCGCSPCSASCGGCASCGSAVSGGYAMSGGCSSCGSTSAPLATTVLPAPGYMSAPAADHGYMVPAPTFAPSSPTLAPSSPATISPPTQPGASSEPQPRTFVPGATKPPISPTAPSSGASSSGTIYRIPANAEGGHTIEPPRIQGVDPLPNSGPQLSPPPLPRPTNENLTTSRPILQATYFKLAPSPSAKVPAQMIADPASAMPMPVDDGGWHHADD